MIKKISEYLDINDEVLYEGVIRQGVPGDYTSETFKVRQSSKLDLSYLDPNPTGPGFYVSEEYRAAYNSSPNIDEYYKSYDGDQNRKLNNIDASVLRNATIADVGCGGGSFLDLVSGLTKKTFAIEPYAGYHEGLSKNHTPYSLPEDLFENEGQCLDHAFSFQVIEHVYDPIEFLSTIAKCCKKGATITIATPNKHDILLKSRIEGFDKFYYRTAHPWYFSLASLIQIGKDANLEMIDYKFMHNYDMANLTCWLRDSKPTGIGGKGELFDHTFDKFLQNWAETNEVSDDFQVRFKVL